MELLQNNEKHIPPISLSREALARLAITMDLDARGLLVLDKKDITLMGALGLSRLPAQRTGPIESPLAAIMEHYE